MDWIKRILSGPENWVGFVVVIAILAILVGGVWDFLGSGVLMKAGTFLVAVVAAMLGLRIARVMRGLFRRDDPALTSIHANPIASAILRGCYVLAAFLLAGAAFGQSPSPAAWPDPAPGGFTDRGADYSRINSPVAATAPPGASVWPSRFAACEAWRGDIEAAVARWWGAWAYPDAWAAQLYQESLCDPHAVSPVGAAGLAQFMPATWREARNRLGLPVQYTPHDDIAVEAGAWYMSRQMAIWRAPRPPVRRWELALASYNAGAGNIIRAQAECAGARDWDAILPCLPDVTGHHARETTQYVIRIRHHWQAMAGDDPLALPAGWGG